MTGLLAYPAAGHAGASGLPFAFGDAPVAAFEHGPAHRGLTALGVLLDGPVYGGHRSLRGDVGLDAESAAAGDLGWDPATPGVPVAVAVDDDPWLVVVGAFPGVTPQSPMPHQTHASNIRAYPEEIHK